MGRKKLSFEYLLLFAVFIIATCGLIYELVAGTLASYLLGDSVKQFSFIIGVYLFSMGIGSYFSKFIKSNQLNTFIEIEILVGIIGGLSSVVLFVLFEKVDYFQFVLYLLVFVTGCLVGLEIPLLMNILKDRVAFSDLVSNVFTFDYIGALLASVLFPLVLIPQLGVMKTSLFFGMINIGIAIVLSFVLANEIRRPYLLKIKSIFCFVVLLVTFVFSDQILAYSEEKLYGENVVFTHTTPYQRIVLTHNKNDYKLYLNNNLQFCSSDEYRYHEALVHPVMECAPSVKNVLVLGGGDGLAIREVLKYKDTDSITLVDLDEKMTSMFAENPILRGFNKDSFLNQKVKVINNDAFLWLKQCQKKFDVVIVDFPDPSNYSLGKLYSQKFYERLQEVLSPNAVIVVQTTSPYFAPKSFWCINKTIGKSFVKTDAYHVYVPSFGEWGYSIASNNPGLDFNQVHRKVDGLHFYEHKFSKLNYFSKDMKAVNVEVNRLDNQILVRYFDEEWGNYNSFTRRNFLKSLSALAVLVAMPGVFTACRNEVLKWVFKLTGANHILGHRLWLKDFPEPSETIHIPVVIIGAGVTGLSAARQFKKKGFDDFLVLELEDRIGGNSGFGENKLSRFPLAAHYLPLPNPNDVQLIEFLTESGIITHTENDLPFFDEEQLCFKPQERLFIRNAWQDDLVPKYGNSKKDNSDFERFFKLMHDIRDEKGSDGKYFFDIPLQKCSDDVKYHYLDSLTMKEWLLKQSFESEELNEYVNYCCRDDFGFGIDAVSAWAGVFYFTARKNHMYGKDAVLTWPEGNGRLVSHLSKFAKEKIKKKQLVFEVKTLKNSVEVLCFDDMQKKTVKYVAQKVICATPQYVNDYLFPKRKIGKGFQYAPWFTATITLDYNFNADNYPLSWDNVIYKSKGLGYVFNQHQSLGQDILEKVITYYYSFPDGGAVNNRKKLFKMKQKDFEDVIIADLMIAHPDIASHIQSVEIYKIGHGMIGPVPDFLFGNLKKEAEKSIEDKVFFAHSDLSGISIFEEAFHQGINTAEKIL